MFEVSNWWSWLVGISPDHRRDAALPMLKNSCGVFDFASFVRDKKIGEGEDAVPVYGQDSSGRAFAAVFDGLGGAGSVKYPHRDKSGIRNLSGAYLASRHAAATVSAYLKQTTDWRVDEVFALGLQRRLEESFAIILRKYGVQPSRLKSSMARLFPTTMALLAVELGDSSDAMVDAKIISVWAGDSRCYLIDRNGLQSLSFDDVSHDHDQHTGLAQFSQDGVINNCICSDRQFKLNSRVYAVRMPLLAIVATDGCYGYVPTPAHLEQEILESLQKSTSYGEWGTLLCEKLARVAADDLSMAVICIGFDDFSACKAYFSERLIEISKSLSALHELDSQFAQVGSDLVALEAQLEALRVRREETFSEFWEQYGVVYGERLRQCQILGK